MLPTWLQHLPREKKLIIITIIIIIIIIITKIYSALIYRYTEQPCTTTVQFGDLYPAFLLALKLEKKHLWEKGSKGMGLGTGVSSGIQERVQVPRCRWRPGDKAPPLPPPQKWKSKQLSIKMILEIYAYTTPFTRPPKVFAQ